MSENLQLFVKLCRKISTFCIAYSLSHRAAASLKSRSPFGQKIFHRYTRLVGEKFQPRDYVRRGGGLCAESAQSGYVTCRRCNSEIIQAASSWRRWRRWRRRIDASKLMPLMAGACVCTSAGAQRRIIYRERSLYATVTTRCWVSI